MGCGGSTLTVSAAGEAVPEKIRPLLRRRLEEFKKRSHARVLKGSKTLSKKELLNHGTAASDDEETPENDVIGSSVRSATVVPVSPKEKKKESLSDKKVEENQDEDDENEKESEKLKLVTEMEENRVENVKSENEGKDNEELDNEGEEKEEEGDQKEEDEGRLSSFDGSMICPGSPSFRIYCVDVSDTDNEDEKTNKELETENGMDNNAKRNEKSTTTENKKGKRGARFRRVLPKRYSGKNLFSSAKFSYIPGCMSHQHHNAPPAQRNTV